MKKQKQKGDTTFCLPFAYTVEDFLQAMKFPSGGEREGGIRQKEWAWINQRTHVHTWLIHVSKNHYNIVK